MKKLILTCAFLLSVIASYGQGRVNFSNAGFLVTTNTTSLGGSSGNMTGAGLYYFGLYLGADANNLSATPVLLATNIGLAGRLTGGNPAPLPGAYAAGTAYAFQIRGWSASGGDLSYEAALARAYGDTSILVGQSVVGSVTPTLSPNGAGVLFGSGAGQVGGFQLAPVPEPSSIALGLLGLGAIALFRRRK